LDFRFPIAGQRTGDSFEQNFPHVFSLKPKSK
jgi:hypothetical protein